MGLFSGISKALGSISGGDWLSAGAGVIGGLIGQQGQSSANETNVGLAREQMAFQERMRDTGYQAAVKDLRKAGLNPMLAYGNGPAPSPAGSLPHVENSAASGIRGALDAASMRLIKAQTVAAESQAAATSAQAVQIQEATRGVAADSDVKQFESDMLRKYRGVKDAVYVKELDARGAYAMYKNAQSDNDRDTIFDMRRKAQDLGFRTIEAALKNQEFLQYANDLYQSKLKNAEFESFSDMYKTDYGKNVAPYVNSASSAVGAAAGAVRGFSALRAAKRPINIYKGK